MVVTFSPREAGSWNQVELVEAAREGDADAWELLFREHHRRLIGYFSRRASRSHAEDLASDVFLQAFRSIRRFTWQGKPFESWLYGIARRQLAAHYRSQRPLAQGTTSVVDDQYLEVEIDDILGRLPADYRRAIELRFVEGLSGIEAAAAMGRTHGAFRSLLLRAVRAYRVESADGEGPSVDRPALATLDREAPSRCSG